MDAPPDNFKQAADYVRREFVEFVKNYEPVETKDRVAITDQPMEEPVVDEAIQEMHDRKNESFQELKLLMQVEREATTQKNSHILVDL